MKTFREVVRDEQFAISAELTLKRNSDADEILRQAGVLGQYVDGIQVTDNPYAWVQISALSACSILIDHGVDPVPVLSCRDRNRIALQSDLLGLRALGVSSLILARGQRVPKNHSVPASTVFDLTGRELIALAFAMNEEGPVSPARTNEAGDFFIGTAARVFLPNPGWRAESLAARFKAGARFMQTQLCFNLDILRIYMKAFTHTSLARDNAVIVSLMPLPSVETARWIKQNMGDARIPESVIQRLVDAKKPVEEGIRICAELIQEISEIPGVSGVNLLTTGDPEAIPAAIKASGLRN